VNRMAENADITPLETDRRRCLACGYRLAGLPTVHICPECGMPYDLLARAFPCSEGSVPYGWIKAGAFAFVVFALPVLKWVGMLVPGYVVLVVGCVVSVLCGLLEAWQRNTGQYRLFVNHRGIQFGCPVVRLKEISWREFGEARFSWITGSLTIRSPQGKRAVKASYISFGGSIAAGEVARHLNNVAPHYRNMDPAHVNSLAEADEPFAQRSDEAS